MRLKLNFFHLNANCDKNADGNVKNYLKFNKIVFPVNLNENFTIRDLKLSISKFLMVLCKSEIEVEFLCLNEFHLWDEFEIDSILNADDELRVYYKIKSEFTEIAKDIPSIKKKEDIKIFKDESETNHPKKKIKSVELDLLKEDGKEKKDIQIKENKEAQNKPVIQERNINKNVTLFKTQSDSEDDESKSYSNSKSEEKNFLQNKIQRDFSKPKIKQKEIPVKKLEPYKKIISEYYSDSSNNSEEILVVKKEIIKAPQKQTKEVTKTNTLNTQIDTKAKQIKNSNLTNTKLEHQTKIFKEEKISTKEENFDLISPYHLENISYLKECYPTLFEKNTSILFRIYELSMDLGGPAPSGYKKGKVEEFIEDTKYFLIKLDEKDENLTSIYSYDTEEGQIISVHLKDLIELRVEKSERNKPENLTEKNLFQTYDEIRSVKEDRNSNVNTENHIFPEKKFENSQKKQNVFTKILYSQLKKQIEYYFSDKNYYKDKFLLEKANLNPENFIELEIIMAFNKIKTLTNRKQDVIEALKESNVVEFDENCEMIRKKNIFKEFMP